MFKSMDLEFDDAVMNELVYDLREEFTIKEAIELQSKQVKIIQEDHSSEEGKGYYTQGCG